MIDSKEFEVSDNKTWNGKSWWDLKPYMVYMPIKSWVEIKKFIIKVCKKHKCEKYNISSWNRTINRIDVNLPKN